VRLIEYNYGTCEVNLKVATRCRVQKVVVRHEYYICLPYSVHLLEIGAEDVGFSRLINVFNIEGAPIEGVGFSEKLWIRSVVEFAPRMQRSAFLVKPGPSQVLLP
jgi:hypothetical protein